MRTDYALYTVATIFFIITGMLLVINLAELEKTLSAIITIILGLFSIGFGYSQRPKPKVAAIEAPPPAPPTVTEVVGERKTEIPMEAAPTIRELTEVKGIGEKRAERLKAVGINNVDDLAKASANDLAVKLKISPKITGRWIENAKELTAEKS